MKQNLFVILFLMLGISFALISIYLSLQPTMATSSRADYAAAISDFKTTHTTTYFANADLGAIACSIISASCFIVAGNIIIKNKNSL